jgi:uncharacterized protein (TIGR02466 family)
MSENLNELENVDNGLKLDNPTLIPMFPSPLFVGSVSDITLCDRLTEKILNLKESKQGSFELGNFTTNDDLHQLTEFSEFSELVLRETGNVLDFLKVKRENHYISGMWANATNPQHRHPTHLHPNCLLSGILYLKTPEKCGGTVFTDPRPAARVFEPSYEEMFEFNAGKFTYPATKGTMLIWPSWMSHGVERGFTEDQDELRIAIAFNVMMLGKIHTMTGKLELN